MAKVLSINSLANTALFTLANLANNSLMVDMSEKYEHYRRRFREAMDARRLTNEELAGRIDAHSVTISKLRSGKIALDDEWRARIATGLKMDEAALFGEEPMPDPAPEEVFRSVTRRGRKPVNDNRMLNVFGFAAASQVGHNVQVLEVVEQVPRPPGLFGVDSAYALRTRNESMVPRYMPDDILYVNPEQNPRPGDHVIIQIQLHDHAGTETWVKRFEGQTASEVNVYQYNPPARMTFKRQYVRYVHRVLPINELFPME